MTECTFCPNEASCTIYAFDPADALETGIYAQPEEFSVPLCEWCHAELEEVKPICQSH